MPAPVAGSDVPARRLTLGLLLGAGLFWLAFGLFFYLTRIVFQQHSQEFDDWGFAQLDRLRQAAPGLTAAVIGLTFFGSFWFFLPASLLGPWLLRRAGHRRYAGALLLSMAGGALLNELLKAWFGRPRPTSALVYQYGLSFPSGHAMLSVTFYGCLAWLALRQGRRWGLAAALLAGAVLIGLTRIYLHVHYPTDVVAGYAAGVAWLLLLRFLVHLYDTTRRNR